MARIVRFCLCQHKSIDNKRDILLGELAVSIKGHGKAKTSSSGISMAAVHPFMLKLHDDPCWLPFLESIGKSPQQLAGFELNLQIDGEGRSE